MSFLQQPTDCESHIQHIKLLNKAHLQTFLNFCLSILLEKHNSFHVFIIEFLYFKEKYFFVFQAILFSLGNKSKRWHCFHPLLILIQHIHLNGNPVLIALINVKSFNIINFCTQKMCMEVLTEKNLIQGFSAYKWLAIFFMIFQYFPLLQKSSGTKIQSCCSAAM